MFGLKAFFVAIVFVATSSPSPSASPVSGALVSLEIGASHTLITIARADGTRSTFQVTSDATVKERALGKEWKQISLGALKPQEPVALQLDSAGRVREVDAEFELVLTRAVVAQDGYLIGTDGIVRKLAAAPSTLAAIPLGAYVELRTNPATGDVFDAAVSSHPFAEAAAPAVAVTFEVRVPVNTPPSSTIYLATNAQNWTANATRLTPEPGNRWTATLKLAGGTILQYKFTRGSWATGERDAAGADIPSRTLTVPSDAKTQSVEDVVARWADLPS